MDIGKWHNIMTFPHYFDISSQIIIMTKRLNENIWRRAVNHYKYWDNDRKANIMSKYWVNERKSKNLNESIMSKLISFSEPEKAKHMRGKPEQT